MVCRLRARENDMKRIIAVLLTITVAAGTLGAAPRERLREVVADCSRYDGVETVRLGGVATFLVTSVLSQYIVQAADGDEEVADVLRLARGVRKLYVMEYSGCGDADRSKIDRRLRRALKHRDILLEVKDGEDGVQIYCKYDEKHDRVSDVVLYMPGDHTLICLFGRISMGALTALMAKYE